MNSADPTKLEDDDSESENDEWILVADEEDLASSFVDVQEDQENSTTADLPHENVQTEAQIPQSDPDNKTLENPQVLTVPIEPKQEVELQAPIKTSYAEVVRKSNKAKTSWMTRNGKTKVKRKKGRSRPQVTQEEKKTQRGVSSCGQNIQDPFPSHSDSSPCNSLSSSCSLSSNSSLSSSSSDSPGSSSIALPYLPSPPQLYIDAIPEKISKKESTSQGSPPMLSSPPSAPETLSLNLETQERKDQREEKIITHEDRPSKTKKKKKHKKKQSSDSNSITKDTFCNATPEKDGKDDLLLSHRKKGLARSSIHTEAQSVKEIIQKPTRGLERTVACIIGLAVFFGCIRLALGDSTEVVRTAAQQSDTLSLVY